MFLIGLLKVLNDSYNIKIIYNLILLVSFKINK
jgi:hypothetical protein